MKKIIFLIIIIASFTACKKDEESPDKTPMFCKKWKSNSTPVYYITFNSDGSGLYENGSLVYNVSWNFINDQKGFHYRMFSGGTTYVDTDADIETLTDSELQFYQHSNSTRFSFQKF